MRTRMEGRLARTELDQDIFVLGDGEVEVAAGEDDNIVGAGVLGSAEGSKGKDNNRDGVHGCREEGWG